MNPSGLTMIETLVQTKLENANENASHAATQARKNINEQKNLRAAMRSFEDQVRSDHNDSGVAHVTGEEIADIKFLVESNNVDAGRALGRLTAGEIGIEEDDGSKARSEVVDTIRAAFQDRLKDLEDADKLSNFDIQDLSTRVTQMMNAQSTLTKKVDSAEERILNNIG